MMEKKKKKDYARPRVKKVSVDIEKLKKTKTLIVATGNLVCNDCRWIDGPGS